MTLSTSLIAAFLLFAVGMAAPAPFTVGDFSPATGETDLPASLRSSFLIESKHDIQASSRQFAQASCSDSGPCKMDDPQCMSSLALKYTNDFRATQGVGPLKQGTVNQFNNAQKYSGVLRRLGDLEHQELSSVQIGCGSRLSGENIAQNHCDDDPARRCVDAWIGSPPHRRNMLSTYHETMSVGIVFGPRTQIWCTQTFAVQTTFGTTGGCAPIDADNAPASPIPTTSPIATPSVGPNNMMRAPVPTHSSSLAASRELLQNATISLSLYI